MEKQRKEETTQGDAPDTITIVKEIQQKVDLLERKINLIFGDHVLINGTFENKGYKKWHYQKK